MGHFESIDRLLELISLPGPSGDEGGIADWLEKSLEAELPQASRTRLQDNLLVVKGESPRTAIFAHLDTTGFTLGYDRKLIPIGSPHAEDKDALRSGVSPVLRGRCRLGKSEKGPVLRRIEGGEAKPGSRWVYAQPAVVERGKITAPYLDNRAGVWCALRALERLENVAIAFTTGEEQHGHGARVCADWLYRTHAISQALISDLTWHTDDTPCGKGVVISIRDAFCPRQSFLDRVREIADGSEIAHQQEVQSAGSSDGGHMLRSAIPMDWVFIGAPEKRPHTSQEQAHLSDLNAMADMLVLLAEKL